MNGDLKVVGGLPVFWDITDFDIFFDRVIEVTKFFEEQVALFGVLEGIPSSFDGTGLFVR